MEAPPWDSPEINNMATKKYKSEEHPAIKTLQIVPTYSQAEDAALEGRATALDRIVLNYTGWDDYDTFMTNLCDAVMEVRVAKVPGENFTSVSPGELSLILDALKKANTLILRQQSMATKAESSPGHPICQDLEIVEMMRSISSAIERGTVVGELFAKKYALFLWAEYESSGVIGDLRYIGALKECYDIKNNFFTTGSSTKMFVVVDVTTWRITDCSDAEFCGIRLLDIPTNLWREKARLSVEAKLEEARKEIEELKEENRLLRLRSQADMADDNKNI